MKRFHLFSGDHIYPARFADYQGSFDTLEDAKEAPDGFSEWHQILETQPDGSLVLAAEWDADIEIGWTMPDGPKEAA